MGVACIPCKKKKCKCDTGRPYCMQCRVRGKNCVYDTAGDKRKRTYKEFEELTRTVAVQRQILNAILAGGSNSEAIIQKLREDKDFITQVKDDELINENHNIKMEDNILTTDDKGKISYFGETSNFPIIVNGNNISFSQNKLVNSKAVFLFQTVIQKDLVLELLSLYFSWQQTYFNILDKNLFLRDMNSGDQFFSRFLLNCILAKASHFCERPECRTDPNDPSTAGESFYKTAIDLLPQELENVKITTVQGLLLLASRESGLGKVSLGWIHSGMAFRIAIDLGLHLDSSELLKKNLISDEQDMVRRTTFWGCYIFDQGWGFYLGRPRAIQELDITLKFPVYLTESPIPWVPFYEGMANDESNYLINSYPKNTQTAVVYLYRILTDIVVDIYSGSPKKDYKYLLEHHYKRLDSWTKELPEPLAYVDSPMHPAVIMLHTMYFAALIFLFRPFLKLGKIDWKYTNIPEPIEISKKSANSILSLLRKYQQLYTLRKIVNLASYVTSTASTVYFFLGCKENIENLKVIQEMLTELAYSWPDAGTILERINDRISKDDITKSEPVGNNPVPKVQNGSLQSELENLMFNDDLLLDFNVIDS